MEYVHIYMEYFHMNTTSLVISANTRILCADCDHLTAQEDFLHADRTLDFYVCDYVEKGSIYVTENGTDHVVDAGQMIILEKGIRHFGKTHIKKGTRWYYIHFYADDTGENGGKSLHIPKLFSPPDDISESLYRLTQVFQKEGISPFSNTELMRFFCTLDINKKKILSDKIADYLDTHWNERFTSEALERHFYLSGKYMASVFRREKGMTMQEYHDAVKLEKCAAMLRSTLMSVSEISAAAGYSDPLYFSKRFHSYHGISPTGYRKNVKELM